MRAVLFILKLGLKILAAPVVLALMLFTWVCFGLLYPACQPSLAIIQRAAFVAEEADERQAGCRAVFGDGTI